MGNISLPLLDSKLLHMFPILVHLSECEAHFLLINKVTTQCISKDSTGNFENLARCLHVCILKHLYLHISSVWGRLASLVNSAITKYTWEKTQMFKGISLSPSVLTIWAIKRSTYKAEFPKILSGSAGNLRAMEAHSVLLCHLLPLDQWWGVHLLCSCHLC